MTEVQEIEARVRVLPSEDFARFRDWFHEFENELWDRQIESDYRSGKLDTLIHQARAELAQGRTMTSSLPKRLRPAEHAETAEDSAMDTNEPITLRERARMDRNLKYTYWRDGEFFIGFLNDYPDYKTQGASKEDLVENLKSLLEDIESDEVPFIRKVEELSVAW